MLRTAAISVFTVVLSIAAFAQQGPCTEQAIKDASAKQDDSRFADDIFVASPAHNEPTIGKSEMKRVGETIHASRTNESHAPSQPGRIVVAPSGDMAYEYGTVHVSFDEKQSGKHQDFTNAYLRVWKAVDGSCKVAAYMSEHESSQ